MKNWEKWYWGIFSGFLLFMVISILTGEKEIYVYGKNTYTKNSLVISASIGWIIIAFVVWLIIRLVLNLTKKKNNGTES